MNWDSSILWGIVGLFSGYIWHYCSQKRQILTYEITTTTLVSNATSELENIKVEYSDNKINTLYSSIIKIRNTGNVIIDKSDFSYLNPLSITTNGIFILNKNGEINQNIDTENQDICCVLTDSCGGNGQKAIISYEYIAKKEEIILNIFHTEPIFISGKLKDGKLVQKMETNTQQKSIALGIISLILLIASFYIGNFIGREYVYNQFYQEIYELEQSIEALKEVAK